MKKLFIITLLVGFSTISVAQTTSTDPRLTENLGAQAKDMQEKNPGYYEFLVFELDNAYFLTSEAPDPNVKQEIKPISEVNDADGNPFNPEDLKDPKTFNFKKYNFKRTYDNRVVYELEDGTYLVFLTLKEVKEIYKK